MKKLSFVFLLLFAACKQTDFDVNKAHAVCEKAIHLIDNRHYTELSTLYSDDFKTSESAEERASKFNKVLDIIGKMKSDSLILTTDRTGDNDELIFRYKVITDKLAVTEDFTITKESGDYLISKIDIQQLK